MELSTIIYIAIPIIGLLSIKYIWNAIKNKAFKLIVIAASLGILPNVSTIYHFVMTNYPTWLEVINEYLAAFIN